MLPFQTLRLTNSANSLFERAASHVGLDFLAHPFWDKYIEYEERQDAHDKVFAILNRVIHIPMHQYARYFEKFRLMCHSRPLEEVATPDAIARARAEVLAELPPPNEYGGPSPPRTEEETDLAVRARLESTHYEVFTRTQSETNKRYVFEGEIRRPYFHVTELENQQLNNWRRYLDFEEGEGNPARIVALYERCLTTCALYEEFWFRYARWMSAQKQQQPWQSRPQSRDEDVRNIYLRAVTLFVPVSRPAIRLQFACFEEAAGRVDIARDVHAAVLDRLPDCVEAIMSLAALERRQSGIAASIDIYRAQIESPHVDPFVKAHLVTEWALLLWRGAGDVDGARAVFLKNAQWYRDSRQFWTKWLEFELLVQPGISATTNAPMTGEDLKRADTESEELSDGDIQGQRIRQVFEDMRHKSRLSPGVKRELAQTYMSYLQQRGGKGAMKVFLEVDREVFG
jgi:pre-mRNA-processing factor 39